jgi:hypothetical protein
MRPECAGSTCQVLLGNVPEFSNYEFHLLDAELDRVISEGQLIIGDMNGTTDIGHIEIVGISLNHAPVGTLFHAGNIQVKHIF